MLPRILPLRAVLRRWQLDLKWQGAMGWPAGKSADALKSALTSLGMALARIVAGAGRQAAQSRLSRTQIRYGIVAGAYILIVLRCQRTPDRWPATSWANRASRCMIFLAKCGRHFCNRSTLCAMQLKLSPVISEPAWASGCVACKPTTIADMRILLIEPDGILASTYKRALVLAGHQVTMCAGAQAADIAADQTQPDVVVLELQLPGHSGIEFLHEEFRSYSDWSKVPVIVSPWCRPVSFAASWPLLSPAAWAFTEYLPKPLTSLYAAGAICCRSMKQQ